MDEQEAHSDLVVCFQLSQLKAIFNSLLFALGLSLIGIGMLIVGPSAGSPTSGLALLIAEFLSPFLFLFSVLLLITTGKRLKTNDPAMVLAGDRVELQPLGFPKSVVSWEDVRGVWVYEQVAGKNRNQVLCVAVNGADAYVRRLGGLTRWWANLSMSSRGTPFQFSLTSLDQSLETISAPFISRNLVGEVAAKPDKQASQSKSNCYSHPLVGGWDDGGYTLAPGNHGVNFNADGTGSHFEFPGGRSSFRWRPGREHHIEISPEGYSQWWEVTFLLKDSEVSFYDPDEFVDLDEDELSEDLDRADDFFRCLSFGTYSK